MNKFYILAFIYALSFGCFEATSMNVQGNWRWRNDNGSETTATWKSGENKVAYINNKDNIRLRVEAISDPNTTNYEFGLGYKATTDAIFSQITNDGSTNHFTLALSNGFADEEPTTDGQLTLHNTFIAGKMIESTEAATIQINGMTSAIIEYCIKPTDLVVANTAYEFNLMDNFEGVMKKISTYTGTPVITLIYDTQEPVIHSTLTDMNVNVDEGENFATVTWEVPTAEDNFSLKNLTSTHTPGDKFNKGRTTVTYTATDEAGNSSQYSFNINVSTPTSIDNTKDNAPKYYFDSLKNTLILYSVDANEEITITDITGRMVTKQRISSNQSVDLSYLTDGIYLFYSNNSQGKFIKE